MGVQIIGHDRSVTESDVALDVFQLAMSVLIISFLNAHTGN